MSLFKTVSNFLNRASLKELAAPPMSTEARKRFLQYQTRAVSQGRKDVAAYNNAVAMAQAEEPKMYLLQGLYEDARRDALLTSQEENRRQRVLSRPFVLKTESGEVDEEQTKILRKMPAYRKLCKLMLESHARGHALAELELVATKESGTTLVVNELPYTNAVPQLGRWYKDYSEDKFIRYRELPEYGTYILEFYSGGLGLLQKAVPHVLVKRFAQSCWGELCEIFGIPPRVMKTNTQDATMLSRAEQMMRNAGAAAWFIIDETEQMEWATGVSTKGEVYQELIGLCNNEISLLIAGAVMGQDTVNGNRSKDEAAQNMLDDLVQADLVQVAEYWNTIALPALVKLGLLKGGLTLEFEDVEDVAELWTRTRDSLPYFTIDPEWAKQKFGIEITGERAQKTGDQTLSADGFFS